MEGKKAKRILSFRDYESNRHDHPEPSKIRVGEFNTPEKKLFPGLESTCTPLSIN
jgi:hypothetical protein